MREFDKLNLLALGAGRPGLTAAYGRCLAEAAAVCLEDQGHSSGVEMMTNSPESILEIQWEELPEFASGAWADEEFTTEQGAYGIAILVIESLTGLTVVERARKGTGCDYWLGQPDSSDFLFQNRARLEVSGIRKGEDAVVMARVRQKIQQTQASETRSIPAFVVVVEFSTPRSEIVEP